MSASIMFKKNMPIPQEDIKLLLKASQDMAKKYKFKEKDIPDIVSEVRKAKKSKHI